MIVCVHSGQEINLTLDHDCDYYCLIVYIHSGQKTNLSYIKKQCHSNAREKNVLPEKGTNILK